MLIQKGGITRNIDESHLHEYTAKGYEPFAEKTEKAPDKEPKKPAAKE